MYIPISQQSEIPIYQQIVDAIKNAILSEDMREGEPMPSIRSLAKELNISVITSKRAYEELEKAGYIVTVRKKGSFVGGRDRQELLGTRKVAIKQKVSEAVQMARKAHLGREEFIRMVEELYKKDAEE